MQIFQHFLIVYGSRGKIKEDYYLLHPPPLYGKALVNVEGRESHEVKGFFGILLKLLVSI